MFQCLSHHLVPQKMTLFPGGETAPPDQRSATRTLVKNSKINAEIIRQKNISLHNLHKPIGQFSASGEKVLLGGS